MCDHSNELMRKFILLTQILTIRSRGAVNNLFFALNNSGIGVESDGKC